MSIYKEMLVATFEKMMKKYRKLLVNEAEGNPVERQYLQQLLRESGLPLTLLDEQFGGAQGDTDDYVALLVTAGKYALPIAFAEQLIGHYIAGRYFKKSLIGNVTCSWQSVHDTIQKVPDGRYSDWVITYRTGQLLLINLKETRVTAKENLAGESRDTVIFNAQSIEAQVDIPYEQAENLYLLFVQARSAYMIGIMTKILDLTVTYTKERQQFGQPLHKFQAVQMQLATLIGEVVLCQSALENAKSARTIYFTKYQINQSVRKITATAHQIHGAIGVTYEYELHDYTTRLWAYREEYEHELILASRLASMLEKSFWQQFTYTEEEENWRI